MRLWQCFVVRSTFLFFPYNSLCFSKGSYWMNCGLLSRVWDRILNYRPCDLLQDMHQYRAAVVAFRGTSLFDILLVNEDYKVSASGVLERRMHDGFGATQDTEFVPPLLLKSGNEQQLHIDPYHAGCIRSVLPHSERFCKGFLAFVTQRAKRTRKCVAMRITGGLPPSKGISELEVLVPRLVIMRLERTQCDWIDHKWWEVFPLNTDFEQAVVQWKLESIPFCGSIWFAISRFLMDAKQFRQQEWCFRQEPQNIRPSDEESRVGRRDGVAQHFGWWVLCPRWLLRASREYRFNCIVKLQIIWRVNVTEKNSLRMWIVLTGE